MRNIAKALGIFILGISLSSCAFARKWPRPTVEERLKTDKLRLGVIRVYQNEFGTEAPKDLLLLIVIAQSHQDLKKDLLASGFKMDKEGMKIDIDIGVRASATGVFMVMRVFGHHPSAPNKSAFTLMLEEKVNGENVSEKIRKKDYSDFIKVGKSLLEKTPSELKIILL